MREGRMGDGGMGTLLHRAEKEGTLWVLYKYYDAATSLHSVPTYGRRLSYFMAGGLTP